MGKPGVAKSASLKTYKTPNVPKTFSKLLKNDNASTPKMEAVRSNQPCSIKDEIKNAFGFDDTDEDDLSESESMIISPVNKIRSGTSLLELSTRNPSMSRISTLDSFREDARDPGTSAKHQHAGPFRFTTFLGKGKIYKEIAAMERDKI